MIKKNNPNRIKIEQLVQDSDKVTNIKYNLKPKSKDTFEGVLKSEGKNYLIEMRRSSCCCSNHTPQRHCAVTEQDFQKCAARGCILIVR